MTHYVFSPAFGGGENKKVKLFNCRNNYRRKDIKI